MSFGLIVGMVAGIGGAMTALAGAGTPLGARLLHYIPQERFGRVVSVIVLVIDVLLFFHRPE
ncbi:MAG: hypothetical protein H6Q33_3053 [Deltaproteobacteria bacterium]|nr:hypothetical protein [Deltaproteobacteria bacterium]MBP1774520.1 hypothetical protein [candidate division NC10 bacterium]